MTEKEFPKVMTPIEAIDAMIAEGEATILGVKNQLARAQVMDRLGKRLLLRGNQYTQQVGQNQKNYLQLQHNLIQMESAQKELVGLRADMLAEEKK
jgi:hypothetical protein